MGRMGCVLLLLAAAACGGGDGDTIGRFDAGKADKALREHGLDPEKIPGMLETSRKMCEELDDRAYELTLDRTAWDNLEAYDVMTVAQSNGCAARWRWLSDG